MADYAETFLRGANFGYNVVRDARQDALRMQELKSQQAARQLQERQVAQQLAMQMEAFNRDVDYRAEMSKGIAAAQMASSETVPVMGPTGVVGSVPNPSPLTQEQATLRFVLPVIGKFQPDRVPAAMENIAMAQYRQNAARQAGAGGTGAGEFSVRTDPATGEPVTVFQTGPNSFRLKPEGIPAKIDAKKRMEVFSWALNHASELMTMDANGLPTLSPDNFMEAARRASMSDTFKNDLYRTDISSENLLAIGEKMLPLISSRTTGVRGELQRALQTSGLGMLFPKAVDPNVAEADAVARQFAAMVIQDMKSDSNITKNEQERLDRAANTISWTDEASGKMRLATFMDDAVRKGRDALERLGKPMDPKYMTYEEIKDQTDRFINDGVKTDEQAFEWGVNAMKRSYPLFIDRIKESIPR